MRSATPAALALLVLLAACAAPTPRVTYRALSDHRGKTGVPYQLTGTRILFAPRPEKADDTPSLSPVALWCDTKGCFDAKAGGKPIAIVAIAVPIPSKTRPILAIRPDNRHFVETSLSPTYFPDSLRLKVLTIAATDRREEAIKTIGAIAVGAKGLFGAGNSAEQTADDQRYEIDLPQTIDLEDVPVGKQMILTGSVWQAFELGIADPLQRPGRQGFLEYKGSRETGYVLPQVHDAMLASICRPATIELQVVKAPNVFLTFPLTMADPNWLMAIPFPAKGAITFHPLCGMDVSAEATTSVPTDQLAEDFFAQVKRVAAR